MSLRVVSVLGPAGISLKDNGLIVKRGDQMASKVPVEDMAILVLDGPDIVITHSILSYCMDHGVAVITSDAKHVPNGLMLPLAGHTLHTETLRSQIDATVPAKKRVWQTIIKAKLTAQAQVLAAAGCDDLAIRKLIPFVRSGDPDNVEGTAASRYFPLLFGGDFLRDRDEPGLNARLNYGYSIIRSAVARSISGAGLHPALGVHHRNRYNPFCLADDAMEPLRPMVDLEVWRMARDGESTGSLNPATKRRLISLLAGFVSIDGLRYPLLVGLEKYAANLRRSICDGEDLKAATPSISPE